MKKLSREQKKKRKKQNRTARNKRRLLTKLRNKDDSQHSKPFKMDLVEFPNPFPEEMTLEDRTEVIRSIGKKAKKDFEEKFPTIEKWFKEYDALYLLSFCSVYFTSFPEGTDPEVTGKLDFPMHFLEILQAFALYQKRNLTAKPLNENAEILQNELKEIGQVMMLRWFDMPEGIAQEEMRASSLRIEMISHTTAIRNWAYFHQMKRVVLDLAKKVEREFGEVYGISPVIFFEIIFDLIEARTEALNAHLNKIRSFYKQINYKKIVLSYHSAFPETKLLEGEELEQLWESLGKNIEQLKAMLVFHSDLRLEEIFTFDIEQVLALHPKISRDSLIGLFNKLSLSFGELKDFNRDFIILDNPVHHKPFIKLSENKFYSSIWGVIPHLLLNILEELISEDPILREKYYQEIKSKYLEDEVENLFRKAFSSAQISRGNIWGANENDLLVLIDTFAIVVEDKARLVSPTARRGAPLDLKETLKKLIEEPSEQALGFIEFLKNQKGKIEILTRNGQTIQFDSKQIKYYIPLGVTFHHLGMIGSNLKKLIEAKIVDKKLEELAPSMSFTDLECIFELLPLEAEKVHYLARRREFEAHMLYEGDELDLLSFYLEDGFNIGEIEYSREMALNIGLKSKELDPYFVGTNEGKDIKKPKLEMTPWWEDLLNVIYDRKINGWLEASYALLNATKEEQIHFEAKFKELVDNIQQGKIEKPHNWVMFLSGPRRRRYAIAAYPYITSDKDMRNNIMEQILHEDEALKTRGGLVLGVNLTFPTYPYTVFASRMSTDLFDTLTVENEDKYIPTEVDEVKKGE